MLALQAVSRPSSVRCLKRSPFSVALILFYTQYSIARRILDRYESSDQLSLLISKRLYQSFQKKTYKNHGKPLKKISNYEWGRKTHRFRILTMTVKSGRENLKIVLKSRNIECFNSGFPYFKLSNFRCIYSNLA